MDNIEARRDKILNRFSLECGKYLPRSGWLPILERLIKTLDLIGVDYDVAQIKEKFGTLRFYAEIKTLGNEDGSYSAAQYGWFNCAIELAELESSTTCEVCGEYGRLRGGSWMQTLCDDCSKKYWHKDNVDYDCAADCSCKK